MPHQLLARTFQGILERTGLAADQVLFSSPDHHGYDGEEIRILATVVLVTHLHLLFSVIGGFGGDTDTIRGEGVILGIIKWCGGMQMVLWIAG